MADDRRDMIIRWADVRPGDLVLLEGSLITVERVNICQKPWGDGATFTAADISHRLDNGHLVTSERHGDRLTAVRRDCAQADRFSTDPDALAWARSHVEKLRDRFLQIGQRAAGRGDRHLASQWQNFAYLLELELIGGKSRVITPFDERRPEFAALTGEEKTDG